MKNKYRFRSSTLSRHAVPSLIKHLSKIGLPRYVRGIYAGKNPWYSIAIRGDNGTIVLRGCSWGYHGEGPHATVAVLRMLGINEPEAKLVAFNTPNTDMPQSGTKQAFRLTLCCPVGGCKVETDEQKESRIAAAFGIKEAA